MNTVEAVKDARATQLVEQSEVMVKEFSTYEIANNEAYTFAAEDLKRIKSKQKELDELRKSMTRPLDEAKSNIMDFFRRPADLLVQAEGVVKAAMLKFQKAEEAKRQAAEKAVLEQQQKAGITMPVKVESTVEKVRGIKTVTLWKYRIVDVNSIPREFMVPDEKKIAAIGRDTKGDFVIPGVVFYPEETISAERG